MSVPRPSGGGSGDVTGPGSSTDNAIARFNGLTGKIIQNSLATLSDTGQLDTPGPVNVTGGGNALNVTGNISADSIATFPYFSFGVPKVGVLTGNDTFSIEWTPSGGYLDTSDVGIARSGIGVAKITDGSTGDGSLNTLSVIFSGGPTDTTGAGSPEGVVTAVVGSTFRRTDGGTNTTLYRKESGAGNTGWVAVSNAGGGSSNYVQKVSAELTTSASTSTAIPYDNTKPTSSEGAEALTVTITPTNASSILEVRGIIHLSSSVVGRVFATLFVDSETDCRRTYMGRSAASGDCLAIPILFTMVAGTTSPITFRLRYGAASGTTVVNDPQGAPMFDETLITQLIAEETLP